MQETVNVTGADVRGMLAKQLKFASQNMETGLTQEQVASGRLLCTTANSITSNLRSETAARKQLIAEGNKVVCDTPIGEIGSLVMA